MTDGYGGKDFDKRRVLMFCDRQKVHTVPLCKVGQSPEDDQQHMAWRDILSTWKSRVSCFSAEVIHLTADIRLSPLVEKIRCDTDGPLNKNDTAIAGPSVTRINHVKGRIGAQA